jgi:hypothetical protein
MPARTTSKDRGKEIARIALVQMKETAVPMPESWVFEVLEEIAGILLNVRKVLLLADLIAELGSSSNVRMLSSRTLLYTEDPSWHGNGKQRIVMSARNTLSLPSTYNYKVPFPSSNDVSLVKFMPGPFRFKSFRISLTET